MLGIAFKPGTDDLRKSPILNVVEAALADGLGVQLCDPVTKKDAHLKQSGPHTKRASANLSNMFSNKVGSILGRYDDVVVSQNNPKFRQLISDQMNSKTIIDIVRMVDERPSHNN